MIDVASDPDVVGAEPTPDQEAPARRRRSWLIPLVIVGLVAGFGIAYFVFRAPSAPSAFDGQPSVKKFDLPAAKPPLSSAASTSPPAVAVEPGSAREALGMYLDAEIARNFETSFALLDPATQTASGPVAAWLNERPNRLLPESYTIDSEQAGDDGVDLTISATRTPAVSSATGLIPGRSVETWRVVNDGGWRVLRGRPTDVRPQLPSDASATETGAAWLDRAATCDTKGAEALQLSANLLGAPSLRDATCKNKGTWTAGKAVSLSELPNSTVFVSAYGPAVGRWARAVPVTGAGRYTIVLAPLGTEWRVMGVIPQGSPRP